MTPDPTPQISAPDLEQIDADLAEQAKDRQLHPSDYYQPGRAADLDGRPIPREKNGQLQYHLAPHVYRLLIPGNGWAKTSCMIAEADICLQGNTRFQAHPKPDGGAQVMWVTQKYAQFEMKREHFESKWLTPGWDWNGELHRYRWRRPAGPADFYVVSDSTDWDTLQGVEPDHVFVDEFCYDSLWKELVARRRGKTKTRYSIAATATDGLNWAYDKLYLPWLTYHAARGLTEDAAKLAQRHRSAQPGLENVPWIWCWPSGSHADNPEATVQTWAEQQAKQYGSAVERQVRLYGGFRDFAGQPIFDADNLEAMRKFIEPGMSGVLRIRA